MRGGDRGARSRVCPAMRRRTAILGLVACGLGCGAEQAARPRQARPAAAGPPAPVPVAARAPEAATPGTSLAARAAALQERLGAGFTVLVEPPFVVAGDEEAEQVARRAATTIRWSVRRLKEAYFSADPEEVIEVYLLRDAESYYRNARALFAERP